jgi:hypothetical protein
MKRMATPPLTSEFADWLLSRRADIQRFMVNLRFFSDGKPDLSRPESNGLIYGHLVAIAFSLWRAAFLAAHPRDWETTFGNINPFLTKLITDNSFLFPDEKDSGSWMVTYYLQNARLRLLHASKHLKDVDAIYFEYQTLIDNIGEQFSADAKDEWDKLMNVTKLLFSHLAQQYRL